MSWTVPEKIKLTMRHQLDRKQEPGVVRSRVRETSCVVRRPDDGEMRVTVECGHCGREGVFVIQDLRTTEQLRRGPVIRSLTAAVVLTAVVAVFWIVGFGGDSILFQVLAIPASLVLLPIAVALVLSPSENIGVEKPEFVTFGSDTVREGFSYVTRGSRRDQGVACSGSAEPAT